MFWYTLLQILCGLHSVKCTMMVIFWGAPADQFNCSTSIATDSMSTCISSCYNNDSCIVAYQPNSTTCVNCNWLEVQTINMLNNGTTKIAVKMNLSTCPTSDVQTFSNGQILQLVSYTDQSIYNYSISVSGDTMALNAQKTDMCGGNGKLVQRSAGWRCLNATYVSGLSSYSTDVSLCQDVGQVFTALETMEEVSIVIDSYDVQIGNNTMYARTDGVKKVECRNSSATECQGMNGYNRTDPTLSTLAGMVFVEDTTNLTTGICPYADCLQMIYIGKGNSRTGKIMSVCCFVSSLLTSDQSPVYEGRLCSFAPYIV